MKPSVPRWDDLLAHMLLAAITALIFSLFAPNALAGTVVAGGILSARLCGWSALTVPSRPRPIQLILAIGIALTVYQHRLGEPTPGHWFERGTDYRCKSLVEIAHDRPAATVYTAFGEVDKANGEYFLARVYLKNGGHPNFEDSTPINLDNFTSLASVSGDQWRVRLKKPH
jgi:hypothetical protein